MKNKLDSVVIVTNQFGKVATIRFQDDKDDRIISSSESVIYTLVEKYIKTVLRTR